MLQPNEYKAIAAWHKESGSEQYYIDAVQKRAALSGAPVDSIYQMMATPRWVTVRDLEAGHPFRVKHPEFRNVLPSGAQK